MIEFELKFSISHLPDSLNQYKYTKKIQEDIYYDTDNYELLRNGNFMRIRDNQSLDFKLSSGDLEHLLCKELNYKLSEISSDNKQFCQILESIDLKGKNFSNFNEFIKNYKLKILAKITKDRQKYIIDENLIVTVDNIKDLGMYLEAEIHFDDSFNVKNKHEVKDKLLTKLRTLQIIDGNEKAINIGYVELYLFNHNKEAYNLGLYKDYQTK